jgi:hypothetical protein
MGRPDPQQYGDGATSGTSTCELAQILWMLMLC